MLAFLKKKLHSNTAQLIQVVPTENKKAKPVVLELLSGELRPGDRIHPYFTRVARFGRTKIDFTINDTQRVGRAHLMHGALDERGPLKVTVTVTVDRTPAVVGFVSPERVAVYVDNHEDDLAYQLPPRSDVSSGDEVSIYIDANGRKAYWLASL